MRHIGRGATPPIVRRALMMTVLFAACSHAPVTSPASIVPMPTSPAITAFELQGWPRPSRAQLQALFDHARPIAADDPILAESPAAWLTGTITTVEGTTDATIGTSGLVVLTAPDGTERKLLADRLDPRPGHGPYHFYVIEASFDGAPLTITWHPTYTGIGSLEQPGPLPEYAEADHPIAPRPPVAFSPRPAGMVAWSESPTIDLVPARNGRAGRLAITIRLVDDAATLATWAAKAHLSPAQARSTLRYLLPPIPPADPVEVAVTIDARDADSLRTRLWLASRSGEALDGEPVPPPDLRALKVGEAVTITRELGAAPVRVDLIGDALTATFTY